MSKNLCFILMEQTYGSIDFDDLFVSVSTSLLSPGFAFCQVKLRYTWYPLDIILLSKWVHFIHVLWYKEPRLLKDFCHKISKTTISEFSNSNAKQKHIGNWNYGRFGQKLLFCCLVTEIKCLFPVIITYLLISGIISRHFSHVTKSRIFKNLNLRKKSDRNFRGHFLKNHFKHLKLYSNPPSWLTRGRCHMDTFWKTKDWRSYFRERANFQVLVRGSSPPKKI